ncbi:MAG: putative Ig domain-containing protein, partial [Acidobacteriaceae bacterium]|nr:putative Ig domain-containing protein [Acidobacteriaceae bacterium]
VAWTQFTGGEESSNAQILFARSFDCGLTWSAPQTISGPALTNQGAQIAIDPNTGTVYVVWRVFAAGNTPDELMYAVSTNGGRTFSKPAVITAISPFDQGTTGVSFRTNAYPSIAVDNTGRIYVAWSQRGPNNTDARIQIVAGAAATSAGGATVNWTAPVAVDPNPNNRGHQIMPVLAFSAGKLTVAWYDLRDDDLLFVYTPISGAQYSTVLQNDGGAPDYPQFGPYIQDPTGPNYSPDARRQTLDVRAAQTTPASFPTFFSSVQVSSYAFGSLPGSSAIQQLQVNPPNLPMFQTGTVPFFGDYVDIAGPTFISNHNGTWRYNNQPSDPDFTHIVWTDNRDVIAPADGHWDDYVPPTYGTSTTSLYDPTQQRPLCSTGNSGQTGDRNQNIYTAEVSPGLTLSAPGNSKPLGTVPGTSQLLQRAFPIIVANTTAQTRSYQLTIPSQPTGGTASLLQTSLLTQITVQVPPLSTTSRTVFATSTNANAEIVVNAIETTNGVTTPESASVTLNSDPSNPAPSNGTLASSENYTPTISNPNIGNPNIGNPNIGNPNIGNPNIGNPNIGNPNIGNPNIGNQNTSNLDVANPNIGNPNIGNADLSNATISDGTWTVTNTGDTSSAYTVNLFGQNPPAGVKLQLILYGNYNTPIAQGCTLSLQANFVPIANITNVTFATLSSILQPAATNPTAPAITLAPGQSALITVRAYDFNTKNNPPQALLDYNPITQTSPIVVAQAANTGTTQPPITLTILTKTLPPATLTGSYGSQTLQATGGSGNYTWSFAGTAPAGVTLQGNVLSWTSAQNATPGTLSFTVQVSDAAGHTAQQPFSLVVNPPPVISPASLQPATQGVSYSQALSVTGGTAPFGPWTIAAGSSLPNWLNLNGATGALSGTPPIAGTFSFTVQITDANGVNASQAYSLLVNPSGVAIGTTSLPSGAYNAPYQPFTLSANSGTPPYTWSLGPGGVLPVGMTLNSSSGTISG